MPTFSHRQPELLGRSIWGKISHAVTAPVKSAAHVTASAARVTTRVAVKPVAHVVANTARATQHDILRPVTHVAATGARGVGHVAAEVGRFAEREAKRLMRPLIAKNAAAQLHGSAPYLLGGDAADTAAKASISAAVTAPATAAVAASVVAAPAAPAVPFLIPPLVSEIYDKVKAEIAKGLSPSQAAANASAEPWYETVLYFVQTPFGMVSVGMGGVGLYFLLSGKKKKTIVKP